MLKRASVFAGVAALVLATVPAGAVTITYDNGHDGPDANADEDADDDGDEDDDRRRR